MTSILNKKSDNITKTANITCIDTYGLWIRETYILNETNLMQLEPVTFLQGSGMTVV